jgi:hypothetical protein
MNKFHSRKVSAFVLVFILVPVFSQGAFLKSGQNGFGIAAGLSADNNGNGMSIGAGYSAEGVVDFGFTIADNFSNTRLFGEDVTTTGISPSLEMHFIKQSGKTPVSLSLFFGYAHDFVNSKALDEMHRTEYANSFFYGGTVYRDICTSPQAYLQPRLSLGYLFGSMKVNYGDGNSHSDALNTFLLNVGLGVACRVSVRFKFVLMPAVSITKDDEGISFSVNMIFPMKQAAQPPPRHKVYQGM